MDPSSPVTRYLRLLNIFFFSGVMHLLIDIASGIPVHDSGALKFFLIQVAGILVEDIFARSYKALFGSDHRQGVSERLLGYVWVFLFLSWSVPAYLYPILSRSGPEHSTVPFSIVNKLRH